MTTVSHEEVSEIIGEAPRRLLDDLPDCDDRTRAKAFTRQAEEIAHRLLETVQRADRQAV